MLETWFVVYNKTTKLAVSVCPQSLLASDTFLAANNLDKTSVGTSDTKLCPIDFAQMQWNTGTLAFVAKAPTTDESTRQTLIIKGANGNVTDQATALALLQKVSF